MKKLLLLSLSILIFISLLFIFASASETDPETTSETISDTETLEPDSETTSSNDSETEIEPKSSGVITVLYPNEYKVMIYPNTKSKNVLFKLEWESGEKKAEYDSSRTDVILEYEKSVSILKIQGYYNDKVFYTLSLNISNLPRIMISESKTIGNSAEIQYSGFTVEYPVIITNGYQTLNNIAFKGTGKTNIGIPEGVTKVNVKMTLPNNLYVVYTYTEESTYSADIKAKIILDEDYSNIVTSDSQYVISGTAVNAAVLYLNNEEIVREYKDGRFQLTLDLEQGENIYGLTIEDAAGKKSTATIKITRTAEPVDTDREISLVQKGKSVKIKSIIFCSLAGIFIITLLFLSYRKRYKNKKNAENKQEN